MLDLNEIRDTINELEDSDNISFNTCEKLAALYTILDHHLNDRSPVIQEYSEILPSYQLYCKIKRKFELNEINDEAVRVAIKSLCSEIKDFLMILYSNTSTDLERNELQKMLKSLTFN